MFCLLTLLTDLIQLIHMNICHLTLDNHHGDMPIQMLTLIIIKDISWYVHSVITHNLQTVQNDGSKLVVILLRDMTIHSTDRLGKK